MESYWGHGRSNNKIELENDQGDMMSLGTIMFTSFGKASGAGTTTKWTPQFQHYVNLGFGVFLIVLGYNLLTVFLRIKLPSYLTIQ